MKPVANLRLLCECLTVRVPIKRLSACALEMADSSACRYCKQPLTVCACPPRMIIAPSAEKNKHAVATALSAFSPFADDASSQRSQGARCLEIGSGTGQHVALFAKRWPHISFTPSEHSGGHSGPSAAERGSLQSTFASIDAHAGHLANVEDPIELDAAADVWPVERRGERSCTFDVIFALNVCHIAPIAVTRGLIAGAARVLARNTGRLFIYGPFMSNGVHTSKVNADFDAKLRARNAAWGVRDATALAVWAKHAHRMELVESVPMPNNDALLVFRRAGSAHDVDLATSSLSTLRPYSFALDASPPPAIVDPASHLLCHGEAHRTCDGVAPLLRILSQQRGHVVYRDAPVRYDERTGASLAGSPLARRLSRLGLFVRRYDGGDDIDASLLVAWCRPVASSCSDGVHLCSHAEHFTSRGVVSRPTFVALQRGALSTRALWVEKECSCCGFAMPVGSAHLQAYRCPLCHHSICAHCCMDVQPLSQLTPTERACLLDASASPPRPISKNELGDWPALDERGRVFAWFLWTGDNPMPAYLQCCIETFEVLAAAHFCVRIVRPQDVEVLLAAGEAGDTHKNPKSRCLHPAWEYLSYVHRADYLRCEILHAYGGLYCDCDTICWSDLSRLLDELRGGYSAVLPEPGLLYETGMNAGLFRRASYFTRCWRAALRNRLDARLNALQEFRHQNSAPNEDALEWNEILRDLVVPISAAFHKLWSSPVLKHSLEAAHWHPTGQQGFDPLAFRAPGPSREESGASPKVGTDVIILNNNQYSRELKQLTRDEFLSSDCVLAAWVRTATSKRR